MRWKDRLFGRRNRSDELSICCSILAIVLLVISMLADGLASSILWLAALLLLGYVYFRIFSRNVERRRLENERFLRIFSPMRRHREARAERRRQKRLYCFFKCPQCSQVLRVPKGKGRVRITCKACGECFERMT